MAERMGLERDLALVEMTGVRYHADQLSTAAALPALRRAKAAGLDVTAGVSIHHLTLNEFDVGRFPHLLQAQAATAVRGRPAGHGRGRGGWHHRHHLFDAHAAGTRNPSACPSRPPPAVAVGLETLLARRAAALPFRAADADGAVAGHVAEPRAPLRPAGGAAVGRGARPIWCSSIRTRRFGWIASRCARNRRTHPSTGALLQGRVAGTWVGGERVFDAARDGAVA